MKTISRVPWISQVQRNGLPSIFVSAQPCILSMIFFALKTSTCSYSVYVVVNFLSQVIFVFLLFLGMVMYANEVETKEK